MGGMGLKLTTVLVRHLLGMLSLWLTLLTLIATLKEVTYNPPPVAHLLPPPTLPPPSHPPPYTCYS